MILGGITSIDESLFGCCTSLTSITIPGSVTSIGESAFSDCTRLESITIPSALTSIGKYVFANCASLETVYYTGSEEEWAEITIKSGNGCLDEITIVYNYTPEE